MDALDPRPTVAELAAELGAHPTDVRTWVQSLIPFHGTDQVYCDTMSRVLLRDWVAQTIRTEGFLTL